MATPSSVLAWRLPGTGEPGGCHLWGRTESDTTDATWQQQRTFCCEEDTGLEKAGCAWAGKHHGLSICGTWRLWGLFGPDYERQDPE